MMTDEVRMNHSSSHRHREERSKRMMSLVNRFSHETNDPTVPLRADSTVR